MSLSDLLKGLTKDDLAILGEIAVSMSSLEHMTQAAIWVLLNLDEDRGLLITGPLQLNQKTELLRGLAKKLPPEDSSTLSNIISDIDRVRPERNRKLHALWRHNNAMEKIAITLGSDRRSMKETKFSTADLVNTRDEIRKVEFSVTTWLIGYLRQRQALKEKPGPQPHP